MSASICASSVLCPVGRGYEQAWASVRAGLGRIGSSNVMDRHFDPVRMGLVPEDALEELAPEIDSLPLPGRARRMLRVGAPALRALAPDPDGKPIRLYLGLPNLSPAEAPWIKGFALQLARLAGTSLDAANSRVVPAGRAAALKALELALDTLQREPQARIVVGGVDSFLDLRLLGELEDDRRLLGQRVTDGFIPGEGAGFLALSADGPPPPAAEGGRGVVVQAAASVLDPGHRGGSDPARGEGLAQSIELLRSRAQASAPVATTFAGLNGESFDAKLWGIARVRHSDFFAPNMTLEHPADCMGDAGAAAGAILIGLAAHALSKGDREGPALVWAASDHEPRACALLSTA